MYYMPKFNLIDKEKNSKDKLNVKYRHLVVAITPVTWFSLLPMQLLKSQISTSLGNVALNGEI